MLDGLFTWLTMAMGETFGIALFAALGWGMISILLSPCHLSSIPLVIGYISSQGKEGVERSYSLSLVFGIGILITIGLIGAITAALGRMMGDVGVWGNVIVAAIPINRRLCLTTRHPLVSIVLGVEFPGQMLTSRLAAQGFADATHPSSAHLQTVPT